MEGQTLKAGTAIRLSYTENGLNNREAPRWLPYILSWDKAHTTEWLGN